eukprot:3692454-Pleurochrysis_carterae.AAC.1
MLSAFRMSKGRSHAYGGARRRGASLLSFGTSPRRHVRDGRGASGVKGVVDGHDLIDSLRPEPLAHVGCCKVDAAAETPNSFSRISLRVVGHGGPVADLKLAKKIVERYSQRTRCRCPLAK